MNLEAEKGTIAAFLTIENFAATLPFKLLEDDFFEDSNKIIIKVINKLIEDGKESLSKKAIISTAFDMGLTSFNGLTKDGLLIDELEELRPSKDDALLFVKQVKKESIKHVTTLKLKDLNKYINTTPDSLSQIMTKCEDTIFGITSSTDYEENKVIDLAKNIREYINALGDNPGDNGLDIGFPEWQKRVGGVANGRVHMFIATFKTGKSTIGARAALLLSKHIPVLMVDTEMDENIQRLRMFAMLTKIPYKLLEDGYWKNPKHPDFKYYSRIQQGLDEFEKYNIKYLNAIGKTVNDMVPAMRRWIIENKASSDTKNPRGLIVYDYLKLVGIQELVKAKIQEYQQLGLDTIALKNFANKYKVPIITFGQTNREDDMTANCLGASKRIADNVDSLTLFKEKTPEILTKDPQGSHLLRVFAARHGPATRYGEHISLDFDKSVGHMAETGFFTPKSEEEQPKKWTPKQAKQTHDATTEELIDGQFDE